MECRGGCDAQHATLLRCVAYYERGRKRRLKPAATSYEQIQNTELKIQADWRGRAFDREARCGDAGFGAGGGAFHAVAGIGGGGFGVADH